MNNSSWPRNIYPNSQSNNHPTPHQKPNYNQISKSYVKRVKIYLPGKENIRRFSMGILTPNDRANITIVNTIVKPNFESLKEKILSYDSSIDFESYVLKYEDEDKDWVTFSTEDEFKELLSFHPSNTLLKIKICKSKELKKKKIHSKCKLGRRSNIKVDVNNKDFKIGKNDTVLDITKMISDMFPIMKQHTSNQSSNNSQQKVVHHHIICDICGKHNIEGTRYKCIDCPDYDVCENCYKIRDNHHNKAHKFNPIHYPTHFNNIQTHIIFENDKKQKEEQQEKKEETKQVQTEEKKEEEEKKDSIDETSLDNEIYEDNQEKEIKEEENIKKPVEEVDQKKEQQTTTEQQQQPLKEEEKEPIKKEEPEVNEEDLKKYHTHLEILSEMGFKDVKKSVDLLKKNNGNLQNVITSYLN